MNEGALELAIGGGAFIGWTIVLLIIGAYLAVKSPKMPNRRAGRISAVASTAFWMLVLGYAQWQYGHGGTAIVMVFLCGALSFAVFGLDEK